MIISCIIESIKELPSILCAENESHQSKFHNENVKISHKKTTTKAYNSHESCNDGLERVRKCEYCEEEWKLKQKQLKKQRSQSAAFTWLFVCANQ